MELLTDDLRAKLIDAGKQASIDGNSRTAIVKLFDPCGRWTYYAFDAEEAGDDLILFGYCVSPLGPDCDEWGSASFNEIARTHGAFGLPMERDLYFEGVTAEQINQGVRP